MKKIYTNYSIHILIISFVLSCFSFISHAQIIPISNAKTKPFCTQVSVTGVVLNGAEFGRTRYLQDATGGISAFFSTAQLSATPMVFGDSITVTGTVSQFNGLIQISPVSSVTKISSGKTVVPIEIQASDLLSAYTTTYDSRYIKLKGVNSINTAANGNVSSFSTNTNYFINNNAQLVLRISQDAGYTATDGLVGKPAPSGGFDVVGLMGRFCSVSGNTSTCSGTTCTARCTLTCTNNTTGFQLIPRLYSDYILPPKPNFNSKLMQTNIASTSFDISFTTQNEGVPTLFYGTTKSLGQTVTGSVATTSATLNISGLQPATLYYVAASSTNVTGTSTSDTIPMMTKSLSSGTIKAYFIDSTDKAVSLLNNKAVHLPGLSDDSLIAFINTATETLDIAIYNWNNTGLSNITDAVNAAFVRGVKVRVIADGASSNLGLTNLNAGIRKLVSPTGTSPLGGFYGIMHNKFVVLDANATNPNKPKVWCGSTNWTQDQMLKDANNIIIVQDQSLAKAYTMEFEEMWGSNTLIPGTVFDGASGTARFGNTKRANTPREFNIGGKRVELFFSPTDGTNSRIIEAVNSADKSFYFANLLITRTDIATAIRASALNLGSTACMAGILDDTSGATGPFLTIKSAVNNVYIWHKKYPSVIFHHKYLIVDQDLAASDPFILTGSHNWSNAGDQRNDENILVIHSQEIANQYYQEFSARWREMNGTPCPIVITGLEENSAAPTQTVKVYPNPSRGHFTLETQDLGIQDLKIQDKLSLKIFDARGVLVLEKDIEAGKNEFSLNQSGVFHYKVFNGVSQFGGNLIVVQ